MEKMDFENMARIWDRVRSLPAEPENIRGEDYAARLRGYIKRCADETEFYRICAQREGDETAKRLYNALYGEKLRAGETLEREYFFLTGDTYFPKPETEISGSAVKRARDAYAAELCDAARYDREEGKLYRELAALGRSAAARLRAAAERLM